MNQLNLIFFNLLFRFYPIKRTIAPHQTDLKDQYISNLMTLIDH